MKNTIYIISIMVLALSVTTSCVNDLDVTPISPGVVSSANVYETEADYKEGLAKLYAAFAVSGQQGPGGQPDIEGINEDFGNYVRLLWNHQELSTDEAVIFWNDPGLRDFHDQNWTPTNPLSAAMHSRIMYVIALSNEYIRATIDNENEAIQGFSNDARFLRALAYSHGIDLFGAMPFVTEEDLPGAFFPERIERADLFDYVVSELEEILPNLGAAKFEYGRADQGAARMLLAKLYLNAEVYAGTDRYDDCIIVLNDLIGSGAYSLAPEILQNFVADNHTSPELIYAVNYDIDNTQTYGGMTYIIQAQAKSGESSTYGVAGWQGLSVTSALSSLIDDADDRALFWKDGQTEEINQIGAPGEGYFSTKFRNLNFDGSTPAGNNPDMVATDYPMFRLADAYLMYAEAVLRGGAGGTRATALGYLNDLRERAFGDASGNIADADMTLDFIMDERARELFWEGHRRTDLVRFGQFTDGTYTWPWKGGMIDGVATGGFRDVYAIPSAQIAANPNLIQNDGY